MKLTSSAEQLDVTSASIISYMRTASRILLTACWHKNITINKCHTLLINSETQIAVCKPNHQF